MRLLRLEVERGLPDAAFPKRCVRVGEALWRQGDRFEALYALGAGTFKTVAVNEHGREQVLFFAYPREIIGLDGFAGTCLSTAVALEVGWVARVPFAGLRMLASRHPPVQRLLNLLFSEEIRRCMSAIALHGVWPSEARVAAFLLELARRTRERVMPGSTVALSMAGWELGSHLGLRPETVSRAVSALAAARLVHARRRSAVLLDPAGLQAVAAEGRTLRKGRTAR
jgi:CRP/FNR family transcriptional regulator